MHLILIKFHRRITQFITPEKYEFNEIFVNYYQNRNMSRFFLQQSLLTYIELLPEGRLKKKVMINNNF